MNLYEINTDTPTWSNGNDDPHLWVPRNREGEWTNVDFRKGDIVSVTNCHGAADPIRPDGQGDVIVSAPERDERNNHDGRYMSFYSLTPYVGPHTEPTLVEDRTDLVEDEPPARPMIDFSADRFGTARGYADVIGRHKVVKQGAKPATLADLEAVRQGMHVDAYDLNASLLDAMRQAGGVGPNLRTLVAHLGHIVQAVLANHADALPAYEQGIRSRKLAELEEQVVELYSAGELARQELDTSVQAAEKYRELADGEVTRLNQQVDSLSEELARVRARNEAVEDALQYVTTELVSGDARQRLYGYLDGRTAAQG